MVNQWPPNTMQYNSRDKIQVFQHKHTGQPAFPSKLEELIVPGNKTLTYKELQIGRGYNPRENAIIHGKQGTETYLGAFSYSNVPCLHYFICKKSVNF